LYLRFPLNDLSILKVVLNVLFYIFFGFESSYDNIIILTSKVHTYSILKAAKKNNMNSEEASKVKAKELKESLLKKQKLKESSEQKKRNFTVTKKNVSVETIVEVITADPTLEKNSDTISSVSFSRRFYDRIKTSVSVSNSIAHITFMLLAFPFILYFFRRVIRNWKSSRRRKRSFDNDNDHNESIHIVKEKVWGDLDAFAQRPSRIYLENSFSLLLHNLSDNIHEESWNLSAIDISQTKFFLEMILEKLVSERDRLDRIFTSETNTFKSNYYYSKWPKLSYCEDQLDYMLTLTDYESNLLDLYQQVMNNLQTCQERETRRTQHQQQNSQPSQTLPRSRSNSLERYGTGAGAVSLREITQVSSQLQSFCQSMSIQNRQQRATNWHQKIELRKIDIRRKMDQRQLMIQVINRSFFFVAYCILLIISVSVLSSSCSLQREGWYEYLQCSATDSLRETCRYVRNDVIHSQTIPAVDQSFSTHSAYSISSSFSTSFLSPTSMLGLFNVSSTLLQVVETLLKQVLSQTHVGDLQCGGYFLGRCLPSFLIYWIFSFLRLNNVGSICSWIVFVIMFSQVMSELLLGPLWPVIVFSGFHLVYYYLSTMISMIDWQWDRYLRHYGLYLVFLSSGLCLYWKQDLVLEFIDIVSEEIQRTINAFLK
jgi:hypothetical protein